MKFVKKLTALFLAVVMVMAMGINVAAATVTVTDSTGLTNHTYAAYKVFAGTQAADDKTGKLAVTDWGTDVNGTDILTALKADDTFKVDKDGNAATTNIFASCTDAKSVAETLANFSDYSTVAKRFAKIAYANKTGNGTRLTTGQEMQLDPGYYLIVDTTDVSGKDDVNNTALLQVTKDGKMTIGKKNEKPSVEKKVKENSSKYNQDGGYGDGFNDVADYNIGDSVPFELIGTIPDMSSYSSYSYTFHDTASAGLTLPDKSAVKVYLSSDKKYDANDSDVTSGFDITVSGQSLTVSAKVDTDKGVNGLKSIVTNTDTQKYVIVVYSATLNTGAVIGLDGNPNEVYLEYSNNPEGNGTGKTPKDDVIVFTYELDVTKVDSETQAKLKDAEFKLYSDSTCSTEIGVIYDAQLSAYRIAKSGETATTMKTAETTGLFAIKGLDDGTYYLKETKAPSGYNLLTDPIKFTIKATTKNGQEWTDGEASSALTALQINVNDEKNADESLKYTNGNTSTGTVTMTVENKSGSVLPSTGGMGTAVIYVAGIAMIVVAGVVVIARKRMA